MENILKLMTFYAFDIIRKSTRYANTTKCMHNHFIISEFHKIMCTLHSLISKGLNNYNNWVCEVSLFAGSLWYHKTIFFIIDSDVALITFLPTNAVWLLVLDTVTILRRCGRWISRWETLGLQFLYTTLVRRSSELISNLIPRHYFRLWVLHMM